MAILWAITRFFWAWIGQNKEMLFLCLFFFKSSNIFYLIIQIFFSFFGKNENNKTSKIASHCWRLLEAFGAWIVKKIYFQLGWIFFVYFFYLQQLFSPCHSNFFLLKMKTTKIHGLAHLFTKSVHIYKTIDGPSLEILLHFSKSVETFKRHLNCAIFI